MRLLLVAHTEQRCLQHIEVTLTNHIGEELQEKGHQQQSDVHTIDIGIGCDDHLVVAQVVHILFDVQRCLQQIELLVVVNHLLGQSEAVQRLTAQREDSLSLHVAALGDRTRRRVTLRDEDHRLLGTIVLVAEVNLAIAQLLVVERHLLSDLARLLLYARNSLALLLVFENLLVQYACRLGMLVQIVIQLLFEEIDNILTHRRALGLHILRHQSGFGLRVESGLLDIDTDRRNDRSTHVRRIVILLVELLNDLGNRLAQRRLMRTAAEGVLTIHERIICFAVACAVRNRHLDILTFEVDNGVERLLARHILGQQIQQTILRVIRRAVELDRQSLIQVGVVAQTLLDVLHIVFVHAEHILINHIADHRAVLLLYTAFASVAQLQACLVAHRASLAVADTSSRELARHHIHRLDTDTIQTYGLLECARAILATRIDFRYSAGQTIERNTSTIVAYGHALVLVDSNLDNLTRTHNELVDRVIYHLFEQGVDTVIGLRTVTQVADPHTRTQTHLIACAEGFNVGIAVLYCCFSHYIVSPVRLIVHIFEHLFGGDHLLAHHIAQLFHFHRSNHLGRNGIEYLDTECMSPRQSPAVRKERIRAVQHYGQNGHACLLRQRKCTRLEAVNLAIFRASTLGEDGDRRAATEPLLTQSRNLSHRARRRAVDADVAVQCQHLSEERNTEHLALRHPAEVERNTIEQRNIDHTCVVDRDYIGLLAIDLLHAARDFAPLGPAEEDSGQQARQFVNAATCGVERTQHHNHNCRKNQYRQASDRQNDVINYC